MLPSQSYSYTTRLAVLFSLVLVLAYCCYVALGLVGSILIAAGIAAAWNRDVLFSSLFITTSRPRMTLSVKTPFSNSSNSTSHRVHNSKMGPQFASNGASFTFSVVSSSPSSSHLPPRPRHLNTRYRRQRARDHPIMHNSASGTGSPFRMQNERATAEPFHGTLGMLPHVHFRKKPLPILNKPQSPPSWAPVTVRIAPPSYRSPEKRLSLIFPTNEKESDPCQAETVLAALREKRKRPAKSLEDSGHEYNANKRMRRESSSSSSSAFTPTSRDALQNSNSSGTKKLNGSVAMDTDSFLPFAFPAKKCKNNPIFSSYSSSSRMFANELSRSIKTGSKRKMDTSAVKTSANKILKPSESVKNSPEAMDSFEGVKGDREDSEMTSAEKMESKVSANSGSDNSDASSPGSAQAKGTSSYRKSHDLSSSAFATHHKIVVPAHLPTLEEHEHDRLIEERRLKRLLLGVKQAFESKNGVAPATSSPAVFTPVVSSSSSSSLVSTEAKPPTSLLQVSTNANASPFVSLTSTSSVSSGGKSLLLATTSTATSSSSSPFPLPQVTATVAPSTSSSTIPTFAAKTESDGREEQISTVVSKPTVLSTTTTTATAPPSGGFAFSLPPATTSAASTTSSSVGGFSFPMATSTTTTAAPPSVSFGSPFQAVATTTGGATTSSGGFNFMLPSSSSSNSGAATTTVSVLGSIAIPNVIAPTVSSPFSTSTSAMTVTPTMTPATSLPQPSASFTPIFSSASSPFGKKTNDTGSQGLLFTPKAVAVTSSVATPGGNVVNFKPPSSQLNRPVGSVLPFGSQNTALSSPFSTPNKLPLGGATAAVVSPSLTSSQPNTTMSAGVQVSSPFFAPSAAQQPQFNFSSGATLQLGTNAFSSAVQSATPAPFSTPLEMNSNNNNNSNKIGVGSVAPPVFQFGSGGSSQQNSVPSPFSFPAAKTQATAFPFQPSSSSTPFFNFGSQSSESTFSSASTNSSGIQPFAFTGGSQPLPTAAAASSSLFSIGMGPRPDRKPGFRRKARK